MGFGKGERLLKCFGLDSKSRTLAFCVRRHSPYSLPGIGMQIFNAVASRDVPMIQGIVLFVALVSVITNLVVDLLHPMLDPRVTVSNTEVV